jgi:hypothetical protein
MKTCKTCNVAKPLNDFYKQKSSIDGYQRYCKKCANNFSAKSESKNKAKYENIRSQVRNRFREELREYKISRGCARCGENHPAVLELHHTDPSVKDINPSAASGRKMFYEEAEKCIVLCANCHRIEHYGA